MMCFLSRALEVYTPANRRTRGDGGAFGGRAGIQRFKKRRTPVHALAADAPVADYEPRRHNDDQPSDQSREVHDDILIFTVGSDVIAKFPQHELQGWNKVATRGKPTASR
jgi:hypothetical protein